MADDTERDGLGDQNGVKGAGENAKRDSVNLRIDIGKIFYKIHKNLFVRLHQIYIDNYIVIMTR